MERSWNDNQPIYRQLRDRVIAMIIEGQLAPGDALPSVRQVAADMAVNPLTVMKAYQELADSALVEKRRGLGLFVAQGAADVLLKREREAFLTERWPAIRAEIRRLGLNERDLLDDGGAAWA